MQVSIAPDQFAMQGENIKVLIEGKNFNLPCTVHHTMTGINGEQFRSEDYDVTVHGYNGIMDDLTFLMSVINRHPADVTTEEFIKFRSFIDTLGK